MRLQKYTVDHGVVLLAEQQTVRVHIIPVSVDGETFNPQCNIALYNKHDVLVSPEEVRGHKKLYDLLKSHSQRLTDSLLFDVLSSGSIVHGITVSMPEGIMEVTWDHAPDVLPVTVLNLIEEGVQVRCCAVRSNGVMIEDLFPIGHRLIIDIREKKLLRLAEVSQWKWAAATVEKIVSGVYRGNYRTVSQYVDLLTPGEWISLHRAGSSLLLSFELFNFVSPLRYAREHEETIKKLFLFTCYGIRVDFPMAQVHHALEGSLDADTQNITLVPYVMGKNIDDVVFTPFIESIKHISKLDGWLNTKGRRAAIVQTIFNMVCCKTIKDAEKIYKVSVKDIRASYHQSRRVSSTALVDFFKDTCDGIFERKSGIIADRMGFYKLDIDYPQLLRSLTCLSSVYPEVIPLVAESPGRSVMLPMSLFCERFAALGELLKRHKIEFLVDGKRVETIKLTVDCDAQRGDGIDGSGWFDLAPHIMADGLVLSADQREILFNEVDRLESADCIKILDEQSRLIIRVLAKIFHADGVETVGQRENPIVRLPRLRILDVLELRQAGAHVRLNKEDEQLVQRLTNFSHIVKVALPRCFVGSLREYQKNGYQWFAFLYAHHFGACLADDMGLGKTVQVIAFLAGIAEGTIRRTTKASQQHMPHFVIMPPTLVFNWQSELKKFCPTLRVLEYGGQQPSELVQYDVVLATYDRMRINIGTLQNVQFHVVIFDEAQTVKNIHAARTAAARQLRSLFTITLTGTPLENYLGEYYSILDLALPGLLPEYKAFMEYVRKEQHGAMIKRTHPFILRRTKAAILKDLPPKVESDTVLAMDEQQQKIYATTALEVKRAIEAAYEQHSSARANIIALTALLRLRQICISPCMVDKEYKGLSPKFDYLVTALDELRSQGNAVLVFSQFTQCLDLISSELEAAKIPYFRIDGATPMGRRKKIVEEFQDGSGTAILLLSLKTGGVGLNLTRANYVFHVDIWWNPAVENQATDRSHRIGQKNTVFIQRLIMRHTIEEKVLALQEKKKKLFKEVLERAESKQDSAITKQDLDFLLT